MTVSWQDYANMAGFAGQMSMSDLFELRKALLAGSDINAPAVTPGQGFPMRVESLERTLKNTQYKTKHVKLWKAIHKRPAFNTIEEFNTIEDYGALDTGAFFSEGALPEFIDTSYKRNYVRVKFCGIGGAVSHVATVIRPAHGPLLAQEAVIKTMYLLKQLEKNSFYADSDLDATQFDGIEKQVVAGSGTIIDNFGKPVSEDILSDAALSAYDAPNYGMLTDWYLGPKVHSDFSKTFFPRGRYSIDQEGEIAAGKVVQSMVTDAGDVRFVPDIFVDDGGAPNAAAQGDASKRPATPIVSTGLGTNANAAALFKNSLGDLGTYRYKAVAVNQFGRSLPVTVGAQAVAAEGLEVTFGLTPGGGNSPAATYFVIYRTKVGGALGTERQILRIPNTLAAAETTIRDSNTRRPYCSTVFGIPNDSEHLAWLQLAPMMKISLATIDTSVRFVEVAYGTIAVYLPKHFVLIRNVGRTSDFVGTP